MGQQVSVDGSDLGLWKRDMTTNRFTAHPDKDKNCVADTEVGKKVNVGWKETRVAPGKAVECHNTTVYGQRWNSLATYMTRINSYR